MKATKKIDCAGQLSGLNKAKKKIEE